MKLSKKSDYALRAMIYLSANYQKGAVQIKEISAKEKIPQKFLENILLTLRKVGILNSKMGLRGGYELARSPDLITLGPGNSGAGWGNCACGLRESDVLQAVFRRSYLCNTECDDGCSKRHNRCIGQDDLCGDV